MVHRMLSSFGHIFRAYFGTRITCFRKYYASKNCRGLITTVQEALNNGDSGSRITLAGWARGVRRRKKLTFFHLGDGLSQHLIQVVADADLVKREVFPGCAVEVSGRVVPSEGRLQASEFLADSVHIFADSSGGQAPVLQPRLAYSESHLRSEMHLRPKNPRFASFLRLRSAFAMILHRFFQEKKFILVDVPILTSNDCEGAGELFSVATNEDAEDSVNPFFKDPVFLTVSGQLHLEAVAGGLSRVYRLGPTFRAEKTIGRQHLAEFFMLEAEMVFVHHLEDVLKLVEEMFGSCGERLLAENAEDVAAVADGASRLPTEAFPRLTFSQALQLLQQSQHTFQFPPKSSESLKKEHERFLVEHCGGPVFVTHFPESMKPFYMKRTDDDSATESFDLLAPGVGEVCGGSLRETDFQRLQRRCAHFSNPQQMKWYCELRGPGHGPSGGFGLGVERYLQCLLGIHNIKDAIPFPRWYRHCHL